MPTRQWVFNPNIGSLGTFFGYRGLANVSPGNDEPVIDPNRGNLILGTDKPGAGNTGALSAADISEYSPVLATAENGMTCPTINTTAKQSGKIYWGCVKGIEDAWLDDCLVAGPDPLKYGALIGPAGSPGNKGALQNFGTSPPHWKVTNTRIDQSLWFSSLAPGGARAFLNPHGFGYHGCNIEMRWCEIVNFADGCNLLGPNGNNITAVNEQFTIIEQNWIHKGFYANDVRSVDDGQVHCDGIQTNTGRHYRIRGNTIGGNRVPIGYNTWPGWAPSNGPGYNAGDDFAYAALQLTQEIDISDVNRLEDIMIELNWLGGGTATISHPFDRGHNYASTTVRYNKFLKRGTDWGKTLAARATADPNANPPVPGSWIPYQRNTGNGVAISKQAGVTATYLGNVYEDDGTPVPGGG